MRVVVDSDRCQANGLCMDAAPEVFFMDDDDEVVRVRSAEVDPEHREAIDQAVVLCPVRALRAED